MAVIRFFYFYKKNLCRTKIHWKQRIPNLKKVITRSNQLFSKFSYQIQHDGREKAWNSMHTYVIKGKRFFPKCYNKHKLTYGQKENKDYLQN